GSTHFAHPYADPFAHVARRKLKPLVSPIRLPSGVVETRLTIEAVKIRADELAVFHANARIIDKVRHAPRWIDLIVRTVGGARRRPDDLGAVLERLFQHENAG